MTNVWGYSHVSFLAPATRLSAAGQRVAAAADAAAAGDAAAAAAVPGAAARAARREFKAMVRALHAVGIEVWLDVVYNHTNEGGDDRPYATSFRGVDCGTYYVREEGWTSGGEPVRDEGRRASGVGGVLSNHSGCGNTVSANDPLVADLIVDSLKLWSREYRVDGFRFDLATALCRDASGRVLPAPPLIRRIASDPELGGRGAGPVRVVAEPWDCSAYQVGAFPHWDAWGEWNGRYRDDVRRFWAGHPNHKGALATRLCGSADLYGDGAGLARRSGPWASLNFVTAHDGFTLWDLVSYHEKRNEANGEQGRDGCNDNYGWNCGAEGATADAGVLALRRRQARNLVATLLVSRGTPMLLAGDEALATRHGNNNWYGHDAGWTSYDWSSVDAAPGSGGDSNGVGGDAAGFRRFVSQLTALRRASAALGGDAERWSGGGAPTVTWHEAHWDDPESRFLACTFSGGGGDGGGDGDGAAPREDVWCAFNAHGFSVRSGPPGPAPCGGVWRRCVDTNLPSPRDAKFPPERVIDAGGGYDVEAHSCVVLRAVAGDAGD